MYVQYKKGVLDLCVLVALSHKDCYGYELVSEISKRIEISEGTIYPLLRKLRDEGYVTAYLVESSEGPPRKYYALTTKGRTTKITMLREWYKFVSMVNQFLKERDHDEQT